MVRSVLAMLVVAVGPAAGQQTVLLRLTPPAGQVSRYRIEATMSVDAGGMGQFSGTQTMFMVQSVTAVEEGDVRVVDVRLDSMVVDGPAMQAMGPMAERLRGIESQLRIDPRGRVLSMEFRAPDNPVLEGMAGTLEQSMPAAVIFPETPVEPGATWSDTVTTTMGGGNGGVSIEMTRRLTYRLDRIELREGVRHAIVTVAGEVVQTTGAPSGGGGMSMRAEGTLRGEMDIDLDAGRWVRNEIAMAMVAEGPMLPGPMSTQVTVRGMLEIR